MRTIESYENELLRLRQLVISLENKNNLLLLKHSQIEEMDNFGKELKLMSEEFDVMRSQIKFLIEDEAIREHYIEHLEELLEFFVYHDGACHWSVKR
jgi:uncharacterized protein YecA (UPF0149 family)